MLLCPHQGIGSICSSRPADLLVEPSSRALLMSRPSGADLVAVLGHVRGEPCVGQASGAQVRGCTPPAGRSGYQRTGTRIARL